VVFMRLTTNIGYPKLIMGCERAVRKARAAGRE